MGWNWKKRMERRAALPLALEGLRMREMAI